jgi:DNA-directed RNA polymerase specialized sigma24 family protein
MKISRNLEEFYKLNDKDVNKLLHKHFKNILNRFNIEDIKNEIYERLLSKKYIENYRPFKIFIDTKNNIWEFKTAEAKFSTYIFTFMKNYILAYYGNRKNYEDWISLDEYCDRGVSLNQNKNFKKIKIPSETYDLSEVDFSIDADDLLKKLEKKTKDKGTIICENDLELSISKYLENYGKEGCEEEKIIACISEKTNNPEKEIKKTISYLLEKKFLKDEVDTNGKNIYFLNDPDRRSLYNLFRYYLEGYKDKEISEKFNMTVAGVGALKRNLRKEIQNLYKDTKEF